VAGQESHHRCGSARRRPRAKAEGSSQASGGEPFSTVDNWCIFFTEAAAAGDLLKPSIYGNQDNTENRTEENE
jgi:hypothetical protein